MAGKLPSLSRRLHRNAAQLSLLRVGGAARDMKLEPYCLIGHLNTGALVRSAESIRTALMAIAISESDVAPPIRMLPTCNPPSFVRWEMMSLNWVSAAPAR